MKKLLPYIVVIVFILALVATIPFLLQTDKRRQQIAEELSHLLNRKVVIGKLDVSLFPPSLRLSEVAVFGHDPNANPDLQMDKVQAGIGLGDLFGSGFHPTTVTIDHWSWTFHRSPDGRWDTSDWLEAFSHAGSGGAGSLQQLIFHNGECHWMDSYAPVPQELLTQSVEAIFDLQHQTLGASGSLTGAAVPVAFAFQGQGHFLSDTWNGDLRLTDEGRQWALHIDDASGRIGVSGKSAEWRWDNAFGLIKFYGRLPANITAATTPAFLQNLQTIYNADGSSVTLSETSTLAGGATEASLHSESQAGGLLLQATAALKDVPLSALCAPVGGCASLDGNLTAVVPHFQMIVGTSSWSDWNGEASVEIQEGRYHLPDGSIQKLSRAHLLKYMKKKFNGFPEQGLVFARFTAHGFMKGGVLMVDRSLVDSGDVKAAFVGKIDPEHKGLDAMMCLRINDHTPGRIALIPGKYIIGETGDEKVQPIYGHLQGTWDEWMLRSVANFKVPGALKSQLQKALAGK